MVNNIVLTFSCVFFFSIICTGQDITGNLDGNVADSAGTVLVTVNLSVQGEYLQWIRGTVTDKIGHFKIIKLPVGSYNVRASFIDYQNVTIENVQVHLRLTTNLGLITLKQIPYDLPDIVVSGRKPIIDPAKTSYGGNINSNDFEQLPVDRDYKRIATLLPQVNISYFGDEANVGGTTIRGRSHTIWKS